MTRYFQVRVFGRNLTDEQYISSALDVGGGYSQGSTLLPAMRALGGVSVPRTYGVELVVDTENWRR